MDKEITKEAIRQTLNSTGWAYVEDMLNEEANEVKRIKTDGKRFEDIAIETIANDKISRAIKSLLRRVNAIKNEYKIEKTRYV